MQARHIAVLAGCLVALGAMGASLDSWQQALRPGFVFGALGAIGAVLGGIYTDKPTSKELTVDTKYLRPLVLVAVLLTPAMVHAQEAGPTRPSAPPAIANCATPEWAWNAAAARWDATCGAPAPGQERPALGPNLGIFCGRAEWEWAPGENRWVAVCTEKSPLTKSIQVGGLALSGVAFGQTMSAVQTGGVTDPLMRPFLSHPWAASALQTGINLTQFFATDEVFRRHPTLATLVNVGLAAYRGVMVARMALTDAPTGAGSALVVAVPLK